MQIRYYQTNSGRIPVLEYIDSLPLKEQMDGLSVIRYLQAGEMEKIQFKQWDKKIYEVYFYNHNRLFYITVDNDTIYLLHACKKQKGKTEIKDKNLVITRAKELGAIYKKKFI